MLRGAFLLFSFGFQIVSGELIVYNHRMETVDKEQMNAIGMEVRYEKFQDQSKGVCDPRKNLRRYQ